VRPFPAIPPWSHHNARAIPELRSWRRHRPAAPERGPFAAAEVAPLAAEADASNQFPLALWPKLGEQGLLGLTVEEAYGGTGMGYLAHMVAMEEISRASGVGLSYGAHSNL
jgi:alkylation response protein AidB-like acyl-CoA dehydrogenase